ncbi:MAG: NADH-quinone oxidoreductase subunit L [Coriobacteriia bacterium]|nr:NADH-quinone oxidoreductase subunit L [Coriobacteriia bacterium]
MNLLAYAWILPVLPLLAFALVIATGRKLPRMVAPAAGITTMSLVFLASLAMLWATMHGARFNADVSWIHAFGLNVVVGILVDPLSSLMLVIVSLVSVLVQIYSIGYMATEERFRWYFGAISLFTAAMIGVVLSDGWLLMYMCWEVMGLASFLLIGFWYETPTASAASMKAFMVTRLGDVGFGLGLAVMWLAVGSFSFATVFQAVASGRWAGPTLIAAALLLFMGAMGKSAQFPLHVWLPDAMAGPTPGSALIHAATMVAAGVYLVARSYPLFEANPVTLQVVAIIGAITAVMAALIACAMDDIKKVLAYSTISQLGYMMIALGVGSWGAAIFHLMTHAFFKSLLFLAAGSVIHGTNTQDAREMGGLWRKMPWTTAAWVIGALSLAGIPPLAGFWSKDEILLDALDNGHMVLLVSGLVVAVLTAFYMGRITFLAFFAEPGATSKSPHAHESSAVMVVPLVVLATLAAFIGLVGAPPLYAFAGFLGEHADPFNIVLASIAVAAAVGGITYAWVMYQRGWASPDWYLRNRRISPVLVHQFWIDDAYERVIVAPAMVLADLLRKADVAVVDGIVRGFGRAGMALSAFLAVFDRSVVDGAVDGLGSGVVGGGGQVRRIQTGNVQTYLLLLVASIIVLVLVFAR